MTMARHLDDARARAVLALVAEAPRTGSGLAEALSLTRGELAHVTEPLWAAKLLQGEVAQGCCRDPCGTACVSRRMDATWSLSRKGASTLDRRGDKHSQIEEA